MAIQTQGFDSVGLGKKFSINFNGFFDVFVDFLQCDLKTLLVAFSCFIALL